MIEALKEGSEKIMLGVALSGGGARGAAHIGVLKAFEEQNLSINYLTGTSIGALIAGFYAFGVSPEDIREIAKELDWLDVSRFTLSKFGLLSNDEIKNLVEKHIGDKTIEESPIPLAIIAADVETGEKVILKEGKVSDAIMASTCIPGIFVPTNLNGKMLVDGVIVENIPISPLKEMGAQVCVGIDLNGSHKYNKADGLIDVVLNSLEIAVDSTTNFHYKDADVLIPLELHQYSRGSSESTLELYAEGYRSGILALKSIRAELKKHEPSSFEKLERKFRQWRNS